MSKTSNVPQIRFKGFTDAWKKWELSEVADRFDNLRVPISAVDRIPGKTPYYGANGIQDYVDGYTHDGEFLLVAEDGANDLEDYPVNYVNGKIWVNNHAHVIQSKPDIAINSFLMYAIKQLKMNQFIVGGGRAKLNAEVMMSLPITMPDTKEQLLIGDYFQKVDNLITLHQRKLQQLKHIKKAMLEKMFPQDGKDIPDIRFKGFTDAWKKWELSEVADRFDNLRVPISAVDRIPGKTPYYGANGIQDYVDGYTHDGEFLLVAEDGANDLEDYPVNYVNGKIWVNNHAHVIQSKPDIAINSFLMYAIKQLKMNQFIVGGGRAKLNAEVMMSLPITMPDTKEQFLIGEYFQKIDKLITLHQRKLQQLKNIKKALLEKMFV